MRIGILVPRRMDAGGLPGAPLVPLLEKPALRHTLDLLARRHGESATECPVVVTTTDRVIDDPVASYATSISVPVFRGAEGDLVRRVLDAARRFELDWVVALDETGVIVDPDLVQQAIEMAVPNELDVVTSHGVPTGMGVEVFRTEFLSDQLSKAGRVGADAGRRHALGHVDASGLAKVRLAVDTPADARLLEFCLRHASETPLRPVLATLDGLLEPFAPAQPWVGSHGPLLIAEIGSSHEGDFGRARALTEQAIAVRPDFIKFQIYRGDSLVSPVADPRRHGHFQKFELSPDQHLELAHMCRASGIGYLASVWDLDALDWIDPCLEMYKVGSGDLVAKSILRPIAGRGKPIALSTGLATEREVLEAVETLASVDARYRTPEYLALLQCTSAYPIEGRDANLAVMGRLHELTGLPAGYSDHTAGTSALELAAALGARVLEFHFSDRPADPSFRDHLVSLVPAEVTHLQQRCDEVIRMVGSSRKRPLDVEEATGQVQSSRRALYPTRDLPIGHRIGPDDLVALRPNHGIDAREIDRLIGRYAARPLAALAPIEWSDLRSEP